MACGEGLRTPQVPEDPEDKNLPPTCTVYPGPLSAYAQCDGTWYAWGENPNLAVRPEEAPFTSPSTDVFLNNYEVSHLAVGAGKLYFVADNEVHVVTGRDAPRVLARPSMAPVRQLVSTDNEGLFLLEDGSLWFTDRGNNDPLNSPFWGDLKDVVPVDAPPANRIQGAGSTFMLLSESGVLYRFHRQQSIEFEFVLSPVSDFAMCPNGSLLQVFDDVYAFGYPTDFTALVGPAQEEPTRQHKKLSKVENATLGCTAHTGFVQTSSGAVYAWGDGGSAGMLFGDGDTRALRYVPERIPELEHFDAFFPGDNAMFAFDQESNSLHAWGLNNSSGRLGVQRDANFRVVLPTTILRLDERATLPPEP